MEDQEDKFFNGYLRCNMAKIATEVKVREIMPHLPSLTQSDQENIDAKRENTGNYNALQLLLSRLRRRRGWLEEFITALQTCKHSALATQIQQEYDFLKAQPRPSSAEASPQSLPEPATCMESQSTDDIRAVPSTIILPHDLHLRPQVATPSMDVNGVALSSSLCCAEGASTNDEMFSNKPVLLTSSHSVQVHRPFDSPTASPSVLDDGVFSMNSVNQEYGSNFLVNSSERVETDSTSLKDAENVAMVDAKKVASGDAENVTHGDSEWVDPGNANKKPIRGVEVEVEVLRDLTKGALCNEEMVAVNEVDGVIRNDTQMVALEKAEQIVLGDSKYQAFNDASRTVFEEAEKVAFCAAERIAGDKIDGEAPGDDDRVSPGDVETEAHDKQEIVAPDDGGSEGLTDAEKVSPCSVKIEALCEVDRVAPGNVAHEDSSGTVSPVKVESDALIDMQRAQLDHPESAAFSEKEAVTPHDADGVLSHDINSGSGEIKGSSPEKNTTVSSNEDDITPGKIDSIAPNNQENLIHDKEDKVEQSSLEEPELHDPSDHDVAISCHSQVSVIHDRGGHSKVQSKAADITEIKSPCSTENTAPLGLEASDHSYPNLMQNVAKEKDSDIVSQTNPPDAPDLISASLFLGKASSGVSGEGDSVALFERDGRNQDKSESGTHCNGDREANAEGHSKASSEEHNGTAESEAADDKENRALGLTAGGASVGAYSRPLGDKDGGAPEDGGFIPPGDTDSEVSGNGNGECHGKGNSSATAERESKSSEDEGDQTAGENGRCQTQNEGDGVSADVDSDAQEKDGSLVPDEEQIWGPIKGNNMITVEEASREPELKNTRAPGEGDYGGPAEGSCDIPRVRDFGTPDEVATVAPSFTELPKNNLETHHPSSLSDHIPENITPNDQDTATNNVVQSTTTSEQENVVHSYTGQTQKEQEEDQSCSPYLEIRSASSAVPNYSPEAVSPKGTEGVTPGNSELHHLQTRENHCGTIHHENGLISAEAFTPSIDSAPPLNTDSRGPLNSSPPNNEPSQNHSSSTHLTNNSVPAFSAKHEPGSAAYIHMKSHAHETTQNPSNAPVHEATDEQDVTKKLYDLAVQNHTATSKSHVSVVTEANQELSMQNNGSALGNYCVTAAVAGVIAAAVLWQIRK